MPPIQAINKKITTLIFLILSFSLFLSSLFLIPKTFATSYIVTTNNDSGAGSLRDAIDQANINPGADIISFNLPTGQLKISPLSELPILTDDITIDGTTQPGFAGIPMVELDGTNAGTANGLQFDSVTGSIQSLVINNFQQGGAINIVNSDTISIIGSYLGTNNTGTTAAANGFGIIINDSTNIVIGNSSTNGRNIISGNLAEGIYANNAISPIISNNYIGTNIAGTLALPNSRGIRLIGDSYTTSTSAKIGLPTTGGGNLISGNKENGIRVDYAYGTEIKNNIIGLNATQSASIANATTSNVYAGILFQGTTENITVGDSVNNGGNVISGNNGNGIEFQGNNVSRSKISNNIIGTNVSGISGLGNGLNGVLMYNAQDIIIGGIGTSAGNLIANNGKHGISIEEGATATTPPQNISILGNSIRSNTNLGINLENIAENTNYIDPNDTLDVDTGPNDLQNYPTITTQTINTTDITLSGTLNSEANTKYRIELFATSPTFNDVSDREGNEYLGFAQVTTDGIGNASWSINIPLSYLGYTYSVNATRYTIGLPFPDGFEAKPFNEILGNEYFNTSEFNARNFAVPVSATISKSHNQPVGIAPGSTVDYTIPVINTGSAPLTTISVTDILDANLTYANGSCAPNSSGNSCSFNSTTNTITWNIPVIAGNATTNLTYQATVKSTTPTTVTSINNTTNLNATGLIPLTASVSLGINHPSPTVPSNNLSVQADKPQILNGESLTYSVVFTNNGSIPLTGVQVQTTLDTNLDFISCTNSCTQNGQVLTWNVGLMNVGQSNSNIVVVKAKAAYTGNVTTTSNLTATELPLAKTQSITTPVSKLGVTTLPRTGGSNQTTNLFPLMLIVLGLLLLAGSFSLYQKNSVVKK
jgi:uncharacterized repeat protein (TIGR01451 family)